MEYRKYVKKKLWKQFEKDCKINSMDFYGSGVITTAHIVMKALHEGDSPKQAWASGMEQSPGHSGMSAAMVAVVVAKYSPRGGEFKKWCKKTDQVMVNWK
jgi:hypothetical protein